MNTKTLSTVTRVLVVWTIAMLGSLAHAQTSTLNYQSGGKAIRADYFHAITPGTTHPTVVYLYGMDGMLLFPQSYVLIGNWMASQGYDMYILHYFDRTGTTYADPITLFFNYGTWVSTINDGIQWVESLPATDPKRVGIMSISLGSFLALTVAEQNTTIKAVSETSGGLLNPNPVRLPPTLIMHGSADTIVPVSAANQLAAALAKLGVPYQLHIYQGEGHLGFQLGDELDSMWRTVSFFNQYLQ